MYHHTWFLSDIFFGPWICKIPASVVTKCWPAYVASERTWATSSYFNGLLPSPSHTLLLADVRRCRGWVWTAEMFVEWRKLGDAMGGLASLVMLKNNQEAGKHGVFWDRGTQGTAFCGRPGSQNHKLMGRGHLHALRPCDSFPASQPCGTACAVPPASGQPLLGHSSVSPLGSPSWTPGPGDPQWLSAAFASCSAQTVPPQV